MRVLGRTVAVALVTVASAAGLAAAAEAQAPPAPDVDLTPGFELTVARDAGKSGARDARLSGSIGHTIPGEGDGPVAIGARIRLPRGLGFHGDAVPRCSRAILEEAQGVGLCPRRSIVGDGRVANPFADAQTAVVDGLTNVYYRFVNAGRNRIWAVATIYTPALVTQPMAVALSKIGGRRWSYRLAVEVPEILRIVAGVPVKLRGFALGIDGIELAPGYLTFDRSCPKRGRLPYRASLTFLHNDGTVTTATRGGRLRCKVARRT